MKIITKRELIKSVLRRWRQQYRSSPHLENKETTKKLEKLDFNTVSEDEITEIIGNNSWTYLYCDECGKEQNTVMRFLEQYEHEYEANPCDICLDCLKKAVENLELEKKKLVNENKREEKNNGYKR